LKDGQGAGIAADLSSSFAFLSVLRARAALSRAIFSMRFVSAVVIEIV
jgi:hypothetical protein